MKAVVWQGQQKYSIENVPDPTPGPGQITVRIDVATICGSDLHLDDFQSTPPIIPGHEASGTIVDIESAASTSSELRVGDRVCLDPVQVCGTCFACVSGIPHLCTRCRHLGGESAPGTWAEFVAIDKANAHLVPESVSMESASLAEPTAVCFESLRRGNLEPGKSIVIVGDGPFGFLHAQIAGAMGAGAVIVAGHHDRRLERIRQSTDAMICNTRDQSLDNYVREHIGNDGADIVVEATGNRHVPAIGLPLLKARGTFVVFSYIFDPEPIDMGLVSMKELNIVGSCRSLEAFDICLAWMETQKISPEAILDRVVRMDDFHLALERLRTKKASTFKTAFRPG